MNELTMSEFRDKITHAERGIEIILKELQKDVDCKIRRVNLIEGQKAFRKNEVVMAVRLEIIY